MHDLQMRKIAELEEQVESFRALSLEQRGELLIAACRAAAEIERARSSNGLPPSRPAPWPESTWELLRRHASHGQQRRAPD
jgi:hypothetical protein